jgi:hypothetical protein
MVDATTLQNNLLPVVEQPPPSFYGNANHDLYKLYN